MFVTPRKCYCGAMNVTSAAQAILDAIKAIDFDWSTMEQADSTVIVAAALRAAADQVVQQEEPPANFLDVQVAAEIDQRRATRADFLAIADELEGITFGTYRCDLEK